MRRSVLFLAVNQISQHQNRPVKTNVIDFTVIVVEERLQQRLDLRNGKLGFYALKW